MLVDLLQRRPRAGVPVKAGGHEVFDLLRDVDVRMPDQLTGADLLVSLEGNVSVKHVVEQDSQAPDGEAVTRVLLQHRPLRWGVDSGALELRVDQGVLGRAPTA